MKELPISKSISLPVDAVTQPFAWVGKRGSGKTYGTGKFVELLYHAGLQFVVLDTVGNWYGLRLAADGKSPGIEVPIVGGLRGDIPLEPTGGALIADILVDTNQSMVIDASQFTKADRQRFATALGQQLWKRKKGEKHPTPIHLVLEESQLIVPQMMTPDSRVMYGVFEEIIRLGRNYGIGISMITQRPQSVNKEVLNQTECLMVFQLNGSQERKAIQDWVVYQGMDVSLVKELPGLHPGECFLWSPQWLNYFKRIKIGEKFTFDSTATPKVGGVSRGKELKPINMTELEERMKATIESNKANDPKFLKMKIAELEKKVANGENFSPKQEEIHKMQLQTLKDIIAEQDRIILKYESHATIAIGELNKIIGYQRVPIVEKKLRNTDRGIIGTPLTVKSEPVISIEKSSNSNNNLPIGEQKILSALIQFPNGLERNQLTVLCGYKRSSRDAYIARLIQKGFAESNGGKVFATNAGKKAMPDYQPLPTGTELQEYWLNKLPGGECQILALLIKRYPKNVTRDDLSESTNYLRSSRDAYLARLAAKELVEFPATGVVKASDNLF